MKGEPVYTFVAPFSAARAPNLNLRCEYQSGTYFKGPPFLLCGRYVMTNVAGTTVLAPFGPVVRMKPSSVSIERYNEQGCAATLARVTR